MTEYNVALLQALVLYHAPYFLSEAEEERAQANLFLGTIINVSVTFDDTGNGLPNRLLGKSAYSHPSSTTSKARSRSPRASTPPTRLICSGDDGSSLRLEDGQLG